MGNRDCANCSKCTWGVKTHYASSCPSMGFTDYKCVHDGSVRFVTQESVEYGKLDAPLWCPLKHKTMDSTATQTEKKKFSELPYWERSKVWEKIPPRIKWEDIEVDKVYHIPPHMNEKRQDILITQKSNFSITYRKLNDTNSRILYTIYPSSLMAKFLVPHMLKEVQVKKL